LVEINLFTATLTTVGFIEFIRKDFLGFAAGWAFALKRFQVLELFIARTMLWCGHAYLLFCHFFSRPD
jgi:hypothetical protein